MSKGKQKTTQVKGGKERKETRNERRARLEAEAEAREFCHKILPAVMAGIVLFIVAFGLYVRSVPPRAMEDLTNASMAAADEMDIPKVDPDL